MRRAVTLIELILAMVIVALVFTVVPRILFVANKSLQTTAREEALYNAMALMGLIVRLPWDEANTESDAVLRVENAPSELLCDGSTGYYRIGGFRGGRNCIGEAEASSAPGREGERYDDLDDYDGFVVETATPRGTKYRLEVSVRYLEDPAPGDTVDFSLLSPSSVSTDVKEVNVTVGAAAGVAGTGFRKSIYYHSVNIGHAAVRKRAWR